MKMSLEQIRRMMQTWTRDRIIHWGGQGQVQGQGQGNNTNTNEDHIAHKLLLFCNGSVNTNTNSNDNVNGANSLHIVTDFDCTLTKQKVSPPLRLLTSYGLFRECPSIPDYYKKKDYELYNVYKPIEVDPNIDVPTKSAHMVEWYKEANKLLIGLKFPADELDEVSKDLVATLRDGVEDLFNKLCEVNIPVLVFSAGLGDAIVSMLKQSKMLTDNVKVVSNFLKVNDEGIITGFQGDVIHVFNKNETAIKETEYFDLIKHKKNVILMGDSIGDASMTDGIEHSEAVLKIGFLFDNVEGNLPKYKEYYDIILVDDQTVDVPNDILNMILNLNK